MYFLDQKIYKNNTNAYDSYNATINCVAHTKQYLLLTNNLKKSENHKII